jgi:hypothetical protein
MGGNYGHVYEEVIPKRQKGITQKCYQKITGCYQKNNASIKCDKNLCSKVQKSL